MAFFSLSTCQKLKMMKLVDNAEKVVVEEVVDELPEESPEVESDEDIKADASLVKAIDTYRKIKEIDKELTEKRTSNSRSRM